VPATWICVVVVCSASYRRNHWNQWPQCFQKRREFATKWCITLCI